MSLYRRIRYRAARSILSVPRTWFYHRALRSKDVFVASYPRSGSTWLRFMLYESLTGQSAAFDNISDLIPEIHRFHAASPILPNGSRLIKTHEAYRNDYKKAIYLVRDVRDIVLSQYARETELGMLDGLYKHFDEYLVPFMEGKTTRFGAWHRHVRSWLDSPLVKNERLLLVQFADLRANTEDVLARIVEFMGVRADSGKIRDAITNNSLEKMRIKEDRAHKLHKSSREEGRFVRRGSVKGWREKLTEGQVQLIERYAGSELARLEYAVGGLPQPRILEQVRG